MCSSSVVSSTNGAASIRHPGDGIVAGPPTPPGGRMSDEPLPYKLLTGTDDRAFCEKVSAALREGYVLYGSPAVTFDGTHVITAQAVVLAERAS
jgi:hypothetical protein